MRDKNKTKPKEQYLKIPYRILNIECISLSERVLLAHIHSYGIKGCWQGNETLGKMFFTSARSISKWVTNLKKNNLVYWVHPKGRYRTIWAKTNPDVATSEELFYMNEKISKKSVIEGHAAEILLRRNLPAAPEENSVVTEKNHVVQVGRNLLHTNNTTNKDTIRATIERPLPLPAGGQAPAALEQRTQARLDAIDNFKKSFGFGQKKKYIPMSDAEFENKKQKQREALLALNK